MIGHYVEKKRRKALQGERTKEQMDGRYGDSYDITNQHIDPNSLAWAQWQHAPQQHVLNHNRKRVWIAASRRRMSSSNRENCRFNLWNQI